MVESLSVSAEHRPRSRLYLWMGAALGFGAPLGFSLIRRILSRSRAPLRRHWADGRLALSYMAASTPIVFGLFGSLLGREEDRRRAAHEHVERLRAEFLAIIAHDLRDPISAIGMQLELLLRHARDGEVRVPEAAVRRLFRSSDRLSEMVKDLLDATQIEALRLRIVPRTVSLPEAVSAMLDELRPTLGTQSLELKIEGAPPPVRVDEKRLHQVLANLVQNAHKYGSDGTPIIVRIRPELGGVALTVEDQGPGIPEAEIPSLFDRFYQGKRAREKGAGLGLGLYITKGIVEAHGGRITVASEVGRGSVFTVWLPGVGA